MSHLRQRPSLGPLRKLNHKLAELKALIRFGNPLAADPIWREADAAEAAARLAHREVRSFQRVKSERVHAALMAGVKR